MPVSPETHWVHGLPLHLQQAIGQAVAARMHRQTDAVQAVLRQRWGDPSAVGPPGPVVAAMAQPVAATKPSPLAELVARLQVGTEPMGAPPEAVHNRQSGHAGRSGRLKRFGQLARRVALEQQVTKALQTPAAHAGPLNARRLVQRVLLQMQSLSPEYLHQFMEQMDTLLWLDDHPAARVIKKKSNERSSNKRSRPMIG